MQTQHLNGSCSLPDYVNLHIMWGVLCTIAQCTIALLKLSMQIHVHQCIKTYRELWEEDDRGVSSCDGWTLVHIGLPHLRNTSDIRTVDLSSTPAERKDEESTTPQFPFQCYRFHVRVNVTEVFKSLYSTYLTPGTPYLRCRVHHPQMGSVESGPIHSSQVVRFSHMSTSSLISCEGERNCVSHMHHAVRLAPAFHSSHYCCYSCFKWFVAVGFLAKCATPLPNMGKFPI